MEEATEKQVKYANSLGIDNPSQFSKMALKELIDNALHSKESSKSAELQGNTTAQHTIVKNITEKPHSYEFGKAGSRHKVYYSEVSDLKAHIETLKQVGLIEDDNIEGFPPTSE